METDSPSNKIGKHMLKTHEDTAKEVPLKPISVLHTYVIHVSVLPVLLHTTVTIYTYFQPVNRAAENNYFDH